MMGKVFLLGLIAAAFTGSLRAQTPAAPQAPPGNAENGKKGYVQHGCWTCHGYAAHGGGGAGPRLSGRVPPWPAFSKQVRQPSDDMVPFTAKVLSDQDLADIYAWLRSIPPASASAIPQIKE